MSVRNGVARTFDREADSFDAIYTEDTNVLYRTWNRIARENVIWRFHFTIDTISPFEGKRILDVGCGSGRFVVAYAKHGAQKSVGLDVSEIMLDIAKGVAEDEGVKDRCEFVMEDILQYRPDEPFDITTAIGFFDYIPDPVAVLAHIRTVTSGTLIASFPPLLTFRTPFRKIWRMMRGCYLRFYTRQQIEEYFEESGWKIEKFVPHGPVYMVVASPRKPS